jgi:hypothetical protein
MLSHVSDGVGSYFGIRFLINREIDRKPTSTMSVSSSRNAEATRWSVTVNLPDGHPEDGPYLQSAIDDITALFDEGEIRYAVGQFERGTEANRLHLQIFIILKEQHRGVWLSNRISGSPYLVPKKAVDDAVMRRYCCNPSKEGYVGPAFEHGGPWPLGTNQGQRNDFNELYARIQANELTSIWEAHDHNPNLVSRNWAHTQRCIDRVVGGNAWAQWLAQRNEANPYVARVWQFWLSKYLVESPREDRKVIFICDEAGGSGKSRFIDEFTAEHGSNKTIADLSSGRSADMSESLREKPCLDVLFVDITRSKNEFCRHVYDFVENLKSGKCFSPKFHSVMRHMPPPHIVIFTNDAIDLGGRKTGEREWDNTVDQWNNVYSSMPLTWDRYVWWDLDYSLNEPWDPTLNYGGSNFPPFKCLRSKEDKVGRGHYLPPHVATSGPEFNGDMAGDGPYVNEEWTTYDYSRWHIKHPGWPSPLLRYDNGDGAWWCMKTQRYVSRCSTEETAYWKYTRTGKWYRFTIQPWGSALTNFKEDVGYHRDWPVFFPPGFGPSLDELFGDD